MQPMRTCTMLSTRAPAKMCEMNTVLQSDRMRRSTPLACNAKGNDRIVICFLNEDDRYVDQLLQ